MRTDEHKLYLGKVDYNGSGRKNCKVYVTWELKDGNFSMCGEIWNPRETDLYCCGQCLDTIAEYVKGNAKFNRMRAIWKRWHLNDMTAGSPAQEAYLQEHPITYTYPETYYDAACKVLAAAGLHPDPNYPQDKGGYLYGSAWLKEGLPSTVVAEIESWSGRYAALQED